MTLINFYERYEEYKDDPIKRMRLCKYVFNDIILKHNRHDECVCINNFFLNCCVHGIDEILGFYIQNRLVDLGYRDNLGILLLIKHGHWKCVVKYLRVKNYGTFNVCNKNYYIMKYIYTALRNNKLSIRLFSILINLIMKHDTFRLEYGDMLFKNICNIGIKYSKIETILPYLMKVPKDNRKQFYKDLDICPKNYIYTLISEGYIDYIKWIIDTYGANFIKGYVAHRLMHHNYEDIIKYAIDTNKLKPNMSKGILLRMACDNDKTEFVRYLLQYDINIMESNNRAFTLAVERGNLDIIKMLVDKNPDVGIYAKSFQERYMDSISILGRKDMYDYFINTLGFNDYKSDTIIKMLRSRKRKAENNELLMNLCCKPKIRKIINDKYPRDYGNKMHKIYNNLIKSEMPNIIMIKCIVNNDKYWRYISKDIRIKIVKMIWKVNINIDKFLLQ